ncbi:RIBOSOMAL RNA SMALL SUBUNIT METHYLTRANSFERASE J [Salix purpurea]|uniref:RIBOSOMAL RNA SMALL SUBUNIT METHYLTRANSFERASE J n=1 Tax=Salix purpurea TaxID=77065 RepID=A0A9Q0TTG4_SALPP|nr:RIBOSOMAL RNA SMALL SUBUNIT METHYLTRANSFERASE J [Salix purpurea]
MAFLATATPSSYCSRRLGSPKLPHPLPSISRRTPSFPLVSFPNSISLHAHRAGARVVGVVAAAAADGKRSSNAIQNDKNVKKEEEEEETIEVEEELPWIQEKALDLVEFTGSVTQAIPGPRVGQSSLPWILALPLAYAGITFVIAFVKTVKKFGSPRYKRKKLVNKNAMLCKSIDVLFQKGGGEVGVDASSQQHVALEGMEKRTGFTMVDIVRKYIRYALNEKPFNPELVASLIQFRKASMLDDSQVAEILNDISRRIVREKGPVVMNMSGYSEKGFKRKLAVQTLFGKVFYLSELPEFCSRDSSLIVKEIFGVADEDADKLRLHTLSEAGNMDSLEKMVDGSDSEDSDEKTSDGSDSEDSDKKTSNAP